MGDALSISGLPSRTEGFGDNILGFLIGVGFTFALFAGIAHFEKSDAESAPEQIEDLRQMSIPLDAPPPKVTEVPAVTAPSTPLAGIDLAPSDSPVKITVVAPDFAALVEETTVAPSAVIRQESLYTNLRPQIDTGAGDFERVFQQYEVDQKPSVLARPNPYVPSVVRGKATTLRASFLIVVNAKGGVDSLRMLSSSGNPGFDKIVTNDIREAWVFQPAAKKGRKVRCLLQQAVRVSWTAGSPFEH